MLSTQVHFRLRSAAVAERPRNDSCQWIRVFR